MGPNWNQYNQKSPQQQQQQHQQNWNSTNWSQLYALYNQMGTATAQKINAPPGFGGGATLSSHQFPSSNNNTNNNTGGGGYPIRFNLNKPNNRFNPMGFNPLDSSTIGGGPAAGQFMSKSQRKKMNKQKKQAAAAAAQSGPAPFVLAAKKPAVLPPLPEQPPPVPPPPPSVTIPNLFNNPTDAWPESLNQYVNRCYSKCQTKFDKDQVDIILKGKITMAANKGTMYTTDWDNEVVPSVHSERAANLVPPPAPPIMGTVKPLESTPKKPETSNLSPPTRSLKSRLGASDEKLHDHSRSPARYSNSNSRRRSRSSSGNEVSGNRRKSVRRDSDPEDGQKSAKKSKAQKNKQQQAQKQANKGGNKKATAPFYQQHGSIGGDVDGDRERLQQRAQRFKQHAAPFNKKRLQMPTPSKFFVDDAMEDGEDGENCGGEGLIDFHIIGTCKDLEKSFLRLTKAPSPSDVRPPDVLVFSLSNVKQKWTEKQDYWYACDQLKSIRQDLTVSLALSYILGL